MALRKKLTKLGNSAALVIDRPILDLLEMNNQSAVEITMGPDGECLVIRPVRDEEEHNRRFEEARKKGNKKLAPALKELAKR
ncbi:MAG: AbrB/MazE/SpoVT family DNA-binding domain-containing protein [Cyanobacteria bacterium HKST-UBA02]|nr:AbrB/MazE/SpoVT family DNA-binding domain-containing protein [Cyanobacteria bacterium HKST-UBA02]